jgi:hypothetical protein
MGPLGIMHLPRLWHKLLLHNHGLLEEGYGHGYRGFDLRLTEMLGIDRDAMIAYVEAELPDYPTFEKWIASHATNISPAAIAAFNESIRTTAMPSPRLEEWATRFNVPTDYNNAVALNNLDDWDNVHAALVGKKT